MNRKTAFESKSVWKAIFTMTVPALITILVMIFYNMADMLFIGQLGDNALIAGVSLISPVFSLVMAFATMIGAGGSVLISSAFGENDYENAGGTSAACFWFCILLGILTGILLNVVKTPLLSFLGARADTVVPAGNYMRILTLGSPLMMVCTACGTLVRAEGAVREGLVGNMIGTITNLILDPLFILVFRWGVEGAAAATVIGNLFAFCYYLVFILKWSRVMSVSLKKAIAHAKVLLEVIPLGVPNAINTILSGLASTFSHQILAGYGASYLAAAAAAGKISMLITMVQMSIAMGVQPLISYHYGAKNYAKVDEVLKKTLILTCGVGIAATIVCLILRNPLIGLFLKDPEASAIGSKYVIYLIIGSVTLGLYYISSNYLQATKHAGPAIIVSSLRQGVLLIPFLYLFHALFGFYGIAIAHVAADVIAAVVAVIVFFHYHQKLNK